MQINIEGNIYSSSNLSLAGRLPEIIEQELEKLYENGLLDGEFNISHVYVIVLISFFSFEEIYLYILRIIIQINHRGVDDNMMPEICKRISNVDEEILMIWCVILFH